MQVQSLISSNRSRKRQNKRKDIDIEVVMKLRKDINNIKRGSIINTEEELSESEEEDINDKHFCKIINDLGHGSFFGEVALISNLRRTCTVYTISNCFFGVIDKQAFN